VNSMESGSDVKVLSPCHESLRGYSCINPGTTAPACLLFLPMLTQSCLSPATGIMDDLTMSMALLPFHITEDNDDAVHTKDKVIDGSSVRS